MLLKKLILYFRELEDERKLEQSLKLVDYLKELEDKIYQYYNEERAANINLSKDLDLKEDKLSSLNSALSAAGSKISKLNEEKYESDQHIEKLELKISSLRNLRGSNIESVSEDKEESYKLKKELESIRAFHEQELNSIKEKLSEKMSEIHKLRQNLSHSPSASVYVEKEGAVDSESVGVDQLRNEYQNKFESIEQQFQRTLLLLQQKSATIDELNKQLVFKDKLLTEAAQNNKDSEHYLQQSLKNTQKENTLLKQELDQTHADILQLNHKLHPQFKSQSSPNQIQFYKRISLIFITKLWFCRRIECERRGN